ncbi:50S ribosomal protein L4 [Patescibacteria group bacterium]|nr:50S ribosomal protein L4 [Patescibacteria group bacterium]MCG2694586.1 50S ribosomal protein L4 [Candidatus Parcubacteria bacterium]
MESKIYNQKGKEAGKVELPEGIFGLSWNNDLVHQVMVSMMSNSRSPISHTKDRGEVSGGGKKPWRQKGTGRARHGSSRSPIWRGGGITFGPTNEKNYTKKINKKMSAKALFTVLSQKLKDGEILFVDNFDMKEAKTKDAKEILSSFSLVKGFETMVSKKKNSSFIALGETKENVVKSFSNFGNIQIGETRNLNILNLLNNKYLVIENPEKSLELLSGKISVKK